MRMRCQFLVAGLLLLVCAVPMAQEEPKSLFDEGSALFHEEEYEEAAAKFREAYAMKPTWKLLYNIGQAEAASKRYGLALEAFEAYLSEGGDEIATDRQSEVRVEADRLRDLVGTIEVKAQKGDIIQVDGMVRGVAPVIGGVSVAAGTSLTVESVREGTPVATQQVKVRVGAIVTVDLTGPGDAEETNEPVPPSESPAGSGANGLKVAGWVTLGVGLAALAASGVTGGLALSKENKLKDECGDTGDICDDSMQSTIDARDTLAKTTTGLWIAGGGLAVIGAVLLIVGKKQSESQVALTPVVHTTSAGMILRVRF